MWRGSSYWPVLGCGRAMEAEGVRGVGYEDAKGPVSTIVRQEQIAEEGEANDK